MTNIEWIVSGVIVVLVFFAVWRAGQSNPVGTGKLARRIATLEGQVADLDSRMDGFDTAIQQLNKTTGDTNVAIAAMRLEMAGDRGVSERTWSAVDRMQQFFIDQALEQAFGSGKRS